MATTTITIGSSTIVCPTTMTKFSPARVTVHTPIDGDVITQRSNNRDNYGDKNSPRTATWDAVPDDVTDYNWTHTAETLKALEGTEVTLDTSGLFGYSSSLSIMVLNVDLEWILRDNGNDWYKVTMTYTHH